MICFGDLTQNLKLDIHLFSRGSNEKVALIFGVISLLYAPILFAICLQQKFRFMSVLLVVFSIAIQ